MKWPQYLALHSDKGSAVKLNEMHEDHAIYYRVAGDWYCRVVCKDNSFFSTILAENGDPKNNIPRDIISYECSYEHYRNDNDGYVKL